MARRFHVPQLHTGDVPLDAAESRHARDVLRLAVGAEVELFDGAGRTATGVIGSTDAAVVVRVEHVDEATTGTLHLTVAAAVPKANRADWMVEKLAEIGVDAFVPLAAARSVVLPEGRGKLDRWERLSTEASKQSRRSGVMSVGRLTDVADVLKTLPPGGVVWCLATEAGSVPIGVALERLNAALPASLTLLIGPEGGWTVEEVGAFRVAGVSLVRLTASVLRIETAALVAAGVVRSLIDR